MCGYRDDKDVLPRGPDRSPRRCEQCASLVEYDSAASSPASDWFLSDTNDSDSEPEDHGTADVTARRRKTLVKSMRFKLHSRFDMDG